ncbi:hypothetical protein BCV70DRAFT_222387, partial [Testicularia cyperi]
RHLLPSSLFFLPQYLLLVLALLTGLCEAVIQAQAFTARCLVLDDPLCTVAMSRHSRIRQVDLRIRDKSDAASQDSHAGRKKHRKHHRSTGGNSTFSDDAKAHTNANANDNANASASDKGHFQVIQPQQAQGQEQGQGQGAGATSSTTTTATTTDQQDTASEPASSSTSSSSSSPPSSSTDTTSAVTLTSDAMAAPTSTISLSSSTQPTSVVSNDTNNGSTDHPSSSSAHPGLSSNDVKMLAGIVAGCVGLVLLASMVLCYKCVVKRRREKTLAAAQDRLYSNISQRQSGGVARSRSQSQSQSQSQSRTGEVWQGFSSVPAASRREGVREGSRGENAQITPYISTPGKKPGQKVRLVSQPCVIPFQEAYGSSDQEQPWSMDTSTSSSSSSSSVSVEMKEIGNSIPIRPMDDSSHPYPSQSPSQSRGANVLDMQSASSDQTLEVITDPPWNKELKTGSSTDGEFQIDRCLSYYMKGHGSMVAGGGGHVLPWGSRFADQSIAFATGRDGRTNSEGRDHVASIYSDEFSQYPYRPPARSVASGMASSPVDPHILIPSSGRSRQGASPGVGLGASGTPSPLGTSSNWDACRSEGSRDRDVRVASDVAGDPDSCLVSTPEREAGAGKEAEAGALHSHSMLTHTPSSASTAASAMHTDIGADADADGDDENGNNADKHRNLLHRIQENQNKFTRDALARSSAFLHPRPAPSPSPPSTLQSLQPARSEASDRTARPFPPSHSPSPSPSSSPSPPCVRALYPPASSPSPTNGVRQSTDAAAQHHHETSVARSHSRSLSRSRSRSRLHRDHFLHSDHDHDNDIDIDVPAYTTAALSIRKSDRRDPKRLTRGTVYSQDSSSSAYSLF